MTVEAAGLKWSWCETNLHVVCLHGLNLHLKIVLLMNKLLLTVQPNTLQIPVIIATTSRHVLPPESNTKPSAYKGVCIKSWVSNCPGSIDTIYTFIGSSYNSAQVSKSTFSASSVPSFSRIDSCSPAIFEWCALIKTQRRRGSVAVATVVVSNTVLIRAHLHLRGMRIARGLWSKKELSYQITTTDLYRSVNGIGINLLAVNCCKHKNVRV